MAIATGKRPVSIGEELVKIVESKLIGGIGLAMVVTLGAAACGSAAHPSVSDPAPTATTSVPSSASNQFESIMAPWGWWAGDGNQNPFLGDSNSSHMIAVLSKSVQQIQSHSWPASADQDLGALVSDTNQVISYLQEADGYAINAPLAGTATQTLESSVHDDIYNVRTDLANPTPPSALSTPDSQAAPTTTPAPAGAPTTSTTTTPTTTTSPTESSLPLFSIPLVNGSGGYSGRYPTMIGFSGDGGNVVSGISWTSWEPQQAVGNGTWTYQNCVPDCATGSQTPYPATITLSDPANGFYRTLTEVTSGPHGSTTVYTYGSQMWAQSAQ
jgi:hypothetical protein